MVLSNNIISTNDDISNLFIIVYQSSYITEEYSYKDSCAVTVVNCFALNKRMLWLCDIDHSVFSDMNHGPAEENYFLVVIPCITTHGLAIQLS